MDISNQYPEKAVPELPPDVWQQICGIMTTKEWVATFGSVCRALHAVQPRTLDVQVPLFLGPNKQYNEAPAMELRERIVEAAAKWTVSHWASAEVVRLRLLPTYMHCCPDLQRACSSAQASQAVKTFVGRVDYFELRDVTEPPRDHIPSVTRAALAGDAAEDFLAWLLGKLPALCTLHLKLHRLPERMPRLDHLTHLYLRVHVYEAHINQCLQHMSNLKVLFLEAHSAMLGRYYDDPDIRELDLSPLAALEEVSLKDIAPEEMSLPPGCALDFDISNRAYDTGFHRVENYEECGWGPSAAQLRTMVARYHADDFGMEGQMRADIPDWVYQPPVHDCLPEVLHKGLRPHALILHAQGQIQFGNAEDIPTSFGGDGVRNVTSLSIITQSHVNILFTRAVRLQRLVIDAVRVSLQFEDASAFASRLEDLVVRCSVKSPEGKSPLQLAGRLRQRGLMLLRQSAPSVVGCEYGHEADPDLDEFDRLHPCYELRVTYCIEGCSFDRGGCFEPSLPDLPCFRHAEGFPNASMCRHWPGTRSGVSGWEACY